MQRSTTRTAWIVALAAVIFLPPLLTWWRYDGSPWSALSISLGVLAACALAAVVVVPSRIRSLTTAFGVEKVMGGHRRLGTVAVALVVLHLVVAVARQPALLSPFTALVLAGLHVWWLGHLVADPVLRSVLGALVTALLGVLAHRWVWRLGRPARPPLRRRRQRVPGRAAPDRSEPARSR